MTFARERIDHLNLAFLDIDEAVRFFAGLGHDGALGVCHDLARRPQRLHMRGGKWCPYHLAQVLPYGLHGCPQRLQFREWYKVREIRSPLIFGSVTLGRHLPLVAGALEFKRMVQRARINIDPSRLASEMFSHRRLK